MIKKRDQLKDFCSILLNNFQEIQIFTKYILSQETRKVNTCFGKFSGRQDSLGISLPIPVYRAVENSFVGTGVLDGPTAKRPVFRYLSAKEQKICPSRSNFLKDRPGGRSLQYCTQLPEKWQFVGRFVDTVIFHKIPF